MVFLAGYSINNIYFLAGIINLNIEYKFKIHQVDRNVILKLEILYWYCIILEIEFFYYICLKLLQLKLKLKKKIFLYLNILVILDMMLPFY